MTSIDRLPLDGKEKFSGPARRLPVPRDVGERDGLPGVAGDGLGGAFRVGR